MTNTPAPIPTPHTTAPVALWRAAAWILRVLHALFGPPSEIAGKNFILRKEHRQIASWLRAAETILRRLLLIEAAALNVAPAPKRPGRTHKRGRRMVAVFADRPEDWPARFSAFGPPDATNAPKRERTPRKPIIVNGVALPPQRLIDAWRIAERYQALLNVFNNPEPFARRLAARLHARPRLVWRVFKAPPDYYRHTEEPDLDDAAALAALRFDSG